MALPISEIQTMHVVVCGLAALTVANIYYWYRSYLHEQLGRERTLRERVAFMLWVTATKS